MWTALAMLLSLMAYGGCIYGLNALADLIPQHPVSDIPIGQRK